MRFWVISALLSTAAQAQEPTIDLPEDPAAAVDSSAYGAAPGAGRRIPIGSYGEAFYVNGDDESEAVLKRVVLFLGHEFDERWRVYSEIEFEDGHELEMEQAFVEYEHHESLGLRAGLVLVPLGIVNILHESPTFHGNQRPLTDHDIVPTTWRELGIGVYGNLGPLHYDAYLLRGLDAVGDPAEGRNGFTRGAPIRGGRLGGNEAIADSAAGVFHLGWSPIGGLDLGASLYHGGASQNNDVDVSVTLAEFDARFRMAGFEARGQFAQISISGTEDIEALRPGEAPDDSTNGLYLELSYDVLRTMTSRHELMPFFRFERLDLGNPDATIVTQGGLTYRPHPQVAFKGDVSRIDPGDNAETLLALGVGFMF